MKYDLSKFDVPIAESKMTVKEIIAHIYRWDAFLLETAIPHFINERAVSFPIFDEFNNKSIKFAETIATSDLLELTKLTRTKLIDEFKKLDTLLVEKITINGKSDEKYSLLFLIDDFVEHDNHHLNQIYEFIRGN
ncbi:MAG: dinB family protein [Bacillales bacterium]|nr:dinB family protein [Bacillales bacterium]